jgi:uncharacterized protein YjbI with pentapeptide repeats
MPEGRNCPLHGNEQFRGSDIRCVLHKSIDEKRTWDEGMRDLFREAIQYLRESAEREHHPLDLYGMQVSENLSGSLSAGLGDTVRTDLRAESGDIQGKNSFAGKEYTQNLALEGGNYPNGVSLARSKVHGNTRLFGLQAPALLDISHCVFKGPAVIETANSGGHVTFDRTVFEGGVSFRESSEAQDISFKEIRFQGKLDFVVIANLSINGAGATISGPARLMLINRQRVSLQGAHFLDSADFRGRTIRGELDCEGMRVNGPAYFDGVEFGPYANFAGSHFGHNAHFTGVEPERDSAGSCFHGVSFRDAKFDRAANFVNRSLLSRSDFKDCTFAEAPEFHGAKIHEAVVFPRECFFRDTKSGRAANAYRTLKLRMEAVRSRNEEAMFFALEQRSLRNTPGRMGAWARGASYVYDKTSNYGRSFGRALGLLIVAWLLFGIAYAVWESPPRSSSDSLDFSALAHGLTFSLGQIVNPFGIWRAPRGDLESITCFTRVLQWVATFQSIVCTGLAALFILALRWQFKRE